MSYAFVDDSSVWPCPCRLLVYAELPQTPEIGLLFFDWTMTLATAQRSLLVRHRWVLQERAIAALTR